MESRANHTSFFAVAPDDLQIENQSLAISKLLVFFDKYINCDSQHKLSLDEFTTSSHWRTLNKIMSDYIAFHRLSKETMQYSVSSILKHLIYVPSDIETEVEFYKLCNILKFHSVVQKPIINVILNQIFHRLNRIATLFDESSIAFRKKLLFLAREFSAYLSLDNLDDVIEIANDFFSQDEITAGCEMIEAVHEGLSIDQRCKLQVLLLTKFNNLLLKDRPRVFALISSLNMPIDPVVRRRMLVQLSECFSSMMDVERLDAAKVLFEIVEERDEGEVSGAIHALNAITSSSISIDNKIAAFYMLHQQGSHLENQSLNELLQSIKLLMQSPQLPCKRLGQYLLTLSNIVGNQEVEGFIRGLVLQVCQSRDLNHRFWGAIYDLREIIPDDLKSQLIDLIVDSLKGELNPLAMHLICHFDDWLSEQHSEKLIDGILCYLNGAGNTLDEKFHFMLMSLSSMGAGVATRDSRHMPLLKNEDKFNIVQALHAWLLNYSQVSYDEGVLLANTLRYISNDLEFDLHCFPLLNNLHSKLVKPGQQYMTDCQKSVARVVLSDLYIIYCNKFSRCRLSEFSEEVGPNLPVEIISEIMTYIEPDKKKTHVFK